MILYKWYCDLWYYTADVTNFEPMNALYLMTGLLYVTAIMPLVITWYRS